MKVTINVGGTTAVVETDSAEEAVALIRAAAGEAPRPEPAPAPMAPGDALALEAAAHGYAADGGDHARRVLEPAKVREIRVLASFNVLSAPRLPGIEAHYAAVASAAQVSTSSVRGVLRRERHGNIHLRGSQVALQRDEAARRLVEWGLSAQVAGYYLGISDGQVSVAVAREPKVKVEARPDGYKTHGKAAQ